MTTVQDYALTQHAAAHTLAQKPMNGPEGSRHASEGEASGHLGDQSIEQQNWRGWFSPNMSDPFALEPFGFDTTASMRDMLGLTGGHLQGQFIFQGNQHQGVADLWFPEAATSFDLPVDPPESPNDGVMRIKYLRAHGRTAYIPGELLSDWG